MGAPKDKVPILCVLNKKDLLKPGEVAQRIEVALKFYHDLEALRLYIPLCHNEL